MDFNILQTIFSLCLAALIWFATIRMLEHLTKKNQYDNEMKTVAPGFVRVRSNARFKEAVYQELRKVDRSELDGHRIRYLDYYKRANDSNALSSLKKAINFLASSNERKVFDDVLYLLTMDKFAGLHIRQLCPFITAHAFVADAALPAKMIINLSDEKSEEYKKAVDIAVYLTCLQTFFIPLPDIPRNESSDIPESINEKSLEIFARITIAHYLRSQASGIFKDVEIFMTEKWFTERAVLHGLTGKNDLSRLVGSILTAFSLVTRTPIPLTTPGMSEDVAYFVRMFKSNWAELEPPKKAKERPPVKLVVNNQSNVVQFISKHDRNLKEED